MGKQSSRLYYQGKDHKEIYYQGHYHDAMYIGSKLVWEKIAEDEAEETEVSLITYAKGMYYVVVETGGTLGAESYPVLYEGNSLTAMKKVGRVFGNNAVSGYYYFMYIQEGELIIIRTDDITSGDYNAARIPISEGGAELNNVSYDLAGIYKEMGGSGSDSRYIYGNDNCYYINISTYYTYLYKNGDRITYLPFTSGGGFTNGKNIFRYSARTFCLVDDSSNTYTQHTVNVDALTNESIAYLIEHNNLGDSDTEISYDTYTVVGSDTANYSVVVPVSDTIVCMRFYETISLKYNIVSSTQYKTCGVSRRYNVLIDTTDWEIVDYEYVNSNTGMMYVYSQMMDDEYRVQILYNLTTGVSNTSGLSYGPVGGIFFDDTYIGQDKIKNLSGKFKYTLISYKIECMARNGNEILIRVGNDSTTYHQYAWISIDIENGTAECIDTPNISKEE